MDTGAVGVISLPVESELVHEFHQVHLNIDAQEGLYVANSCQRFSRVR